MVTALHPNRPAFSFHYHHSSILILCYVFLHYFVKYNIVLFLYIPSNFVISLKFNYVEI